jgi:spermidine synthase
VSVLKYDGGRSTGVFVNGLGQSWIPFGGVHTALGALPVILHPDPADVLIIGLGSGDTVFAAGGRSAVQRLTCVEIIGAQLQTLQRLARTQHDPGLVALLSDPRIAHEVGDGRAFMRRSGHLFDVIEADALRPTSAYSGNLYSREYFALLAKHLKPGGLAVTWAPTERVQKTFLSVFPHVLGLNEIWVGSNTVIPFDRATVQRRMTEVAAYYERANLDIMTELRPYLQSRVRVFGPDDPRDTDSLNTDVFPRDEFQLPGLTR